jgi:hypothetical protein
LWKLGANTAFAFRGLGELAMRRVAVLAIVLGSCSAGAAAAAPPAANPPISQVLAEAAFATDHGAGALLRWSGGASAGSPPGAAPWAYDVRVSRAAGFAGGPLPLALGAAGPAYEVSVIRSWPSAFRFDAGGVDLDLSPHAGLQVGADGSGSAEAGAMVRLSRSDRLSALAGARLRALGVADGAQFGDRGRFYLFAAASGRAVGLNMLRGESGWDRAGWSTDPASRLVGDAQVGLGWRKGPMQTSIGFVHREVKGDHMLRGADPDAVSMVAFSFSIRPQR